MEWPLLIFDLDGTLIDSAADIATALNQTLRHYDKPEVPYPVIVEHIGDGLRKLLGDFFPEHNGQPAESYRHIEQRFFATYEEVMYQATAPFPGAIEFLKSYPGPMGIVTNKNEMPARKIIDHLGLNAIPWIQIFGADTFPEKKPHPRPLFEMMKLAGRSDQNTFMIGDGRPDVQAALAAKVPSIAIGFGYTDIKILQQFKPVAVLEDYAQLHNLVRHLINH